MQGDITKSFGYWGDTNKTYQVGKEFRIRQADMLMKNFANNWIAGGGLGSFDSSWEGYDDWLPRPYLVESEWLNLLSKLGVIGISLWFAAFFCLFKSCINTARKAEQVNDSLFIYSLTAGFLSMTVGSFFQTCYSSILFHLYIMFLLLVLSATPKIVNYSRQLTSHLT